MSVSFCEVARQFFTAFCVRFLVSFEKALTLVRARLKLEVLESSKLLKNGPTLRAKVRVRLKLEVLRYIYFIKLSSG